MFYISHVFGLFLIKIIIIIITAHRELLAGLIGALILIPTAVITLMAANIFQIS